MTFKGENFFLTDCDDDPNCEKKRGGLSLGSTQPLLVTNPAPSNVTTSNTEKYSLLFLNFGFIF